MQRVSSGALPGTSATCSYDAPLLGNGGLARNGATTRITVHGTAGGERIFYLALPSGFDNPSAVPFDVLLALHGGASWGDLFIASARTSRQRAALHVRRALMRALRCLACTSLIAGSGQQLKGTAAGYVVAAPNGLPGLAGVGGTWWLNNLPGDGSGDMYPSADDRVFMADMLKCITGLGVRLSGELMLSGYSMGAKFACRLACTPPDGMHVAAMALAGGIQGELSRACPDKPTPLLQFQGGQDPIVPFCTRQLAMGIYSWAPTQESFRAWLAYNGATPALRPPVTSCSVLRDTVVYDHAGDAPTALWWLPTGSHVWPGVIDGCTGDGTDIALAFFASAKGGPAAAAPQPSDMSGGLTTCSAAAPCGSSTWYTPASNAGGSYR